MKDAQGAVVPGATVTLTSATQGTALTTVSNELGNFFFAYVRPDTYILKVALEGFQTFERTGLVDERILAVELVCATQALDLRHPLTRRPP